MTKFKLGIDLHGVIDALPEEMKFLSRIIVENGGEIHVITGRTLDKSFDDSIKTAGITYTHVFSVYDWLVSSKSEVFGEVEFPDGSRQLKFSNDAWDRVKGDYCARHKISLHLDDTIIYNDYFVTPFGRIWSHNGKAKASHKDVRLIP